MNRILAPLGAVAVIACLAVLGVAQSTQPAAASAAKPAFDKLKACAGVWEAKLPNGGVCRLKSELVSGETALMETLDMEGNMVTVYHLDGDKLVLTHYCAAGNQPHMTAAPMKPGDDTLTFSFTGGSNMAGPDDGHMHKLVTKFVDNDHIVQDWTWFAEGKEGGGVHLAFERVQ